MAKVEVYTKDYCPYCVKAKDLLQKKGVKFTQIDVTNNDKLREELVHKANGRKTLPQIFINEISIGGYDDLYALDSRGELDKML